MFESESWWWCKRTILDNGGELAGQLEFYQKVMGGVEVEEGNNILLADSVRKELLVGPVLSRGGHVECMRSKEEGMVCTERVEEKKKYLNI